MCRKMTLAFLGLQLMALAGFSQQKISLPEPVHNDRIVYVVDGVPRDRSFLMKLSKEDIREVTVLKDAAIAFACHTPSIVILVRTQPAEHRLVVADKTTLMPVSFANLEFYSGMTGMTKQDMANEQGEFTLSQEIINGSDSIRVSATGYKLFQASVGNSDQMMADTIFLERDVLELSTVVVSSVICRKRGCGSCTLYRIDPSTLTSQNEVVAFNCNVFPNPVERSHVLTVQIAGGDSRLGKYVLMDMGGRKIREEAINTDKGGRQVSLSTSASWPAGIYQLVFFDRTGAAMITKSIVLK